MQCWTWADALLYVLFSGYAFFEHFSFRALAIIVVLFPLFWLVELPLQTLLEFKVRNFERRHAARCYSRFFEFCALCYLRWILRTFSPEYASRVFFSARAARWLYVARRFKYGAGNVGSFRPARVTHSEHAFDGYWVNARSYNDVPPSVAIFFVPGNLACYISSYNYVEYVSVMLGELQAEGIDNAIAFVLDLKYEGPDAYIKALKQIKGAYRYFLDTYPLSATMMVGSGIGGTLLCTLLLDLARPCIPDIEGSINTGEDGTTETNRRSLPILSAEYDEFELPVPDSQVATVSSLVRGLSVRAAKAIAPLREMLSADETPVNLFTLITADPSESSFNDRDVSNSQVSSLDPLLQQDLLSGLATAKPAAASEGAMPKPTVPAALAGTSQFLDHLAPFAVPDCSSSPGGSGPATGSDPHELSDHVNPDQQQSSEASISSPAALCTVSDTEACGNSLNCSRVKRQSVSLAAVVEEPRLYAAAVDGEEEPIFQYESPGIALLSTGGVAQLAAVSISAASSSKKVPADFPRRSSIELHSGSEYLGPTPGNISSANEGSDASRETSPKAKRRKRLIPNKLCSARSVERKSASHTPAKIVCELELPPSGVLPQPDREDVDGCALESPTTQTEAAEAVSVREGHDTEASVMLELRKPDGLLLISPFAAARMKIKNKYPDVLTQKVLDRFADKLIRPGQEQEAWAAPATVLDGTWWDEALPERGCIAMYGTGETVAGGVLDLVAAMRTATHSRVASNACGNQLHAWPITNSYIMHDPRAQLMGADKVGAHIAKILGISAVCRKF